MLLLLTANVDPNRDLTGRGTRHKQRQLERLHLSIPPDFQTLNLMQYVYWQLGNQYRTRANLTGRLLVRQAWGYALYCSDKRMSLGTFF